MEENGEEKILRISKPAKLPIPVQGWDRRFPPSKPAHKLNPGCRHQLAKPEPGSSRRESPHE